MLNCFRVAAMAVTLVFASAGVATADPVKVADATRTTTTFDGYELSASLTDMYINSVPNMAATAFTREALVSGVAWQTFHGGTEPITGGELTIWLMFGCQIDLDGGGFIGASPFASITNVLGTIDEIVPTLSGLGPQMSLQLKPGLIDYVKLKEKTITPQMAAEWNRSGQGLLRIAVTDAHIKVDSCGGPVSVRLGATAQLSTKNSDDESNVYGDILSI